MVGNADGTWPFTIDDGVKLAVTPNSTGHYAFNLCLEEIGIIPEDHESSFIYGQQGEVMDAIEINATTQSADANYGGLWAPNIYTVLEVSYEKIVLHLLYFFILLSKIEAISIL